MKVPLPTLRLRVVAFSPEIVELIAPAPETLIVVAALSLTGLPNAVDVKRHQSSSFLNSKVPAEPHTSALLSQSFRCQT